MGRCYGAVSDGRVVGGGSFLQIGDDVGDVLFLLQPDEGHLVAYDVPLGIGEIGGKGRFVPGHPGILHRVRILEPLHRAGRASDDIDQMRPDFVLLLVDDMAGLAFLVDLLSIGGIALSAGGPGEHRARERRCGNRCQYLA
jgi:hypothetical protein